MGIVPGVALHALSQRTPSPICFLWTFLQLHPEILLHEVNQAELAAAEEPAGEHRVENGGGNEVAVLAQEAQVVIRAVENQFVLGENLKDRRQLQSGKRIDEMIAPEKAELNQAQLFRVGMQAVGLRIQRDPCGGVELREKRRQLLFRINHGANIGKTNGGKRENAF